MKFKVRFNDAAELSIGKLIGVIIVVVVAMALLPTLITSVNSGYWATNGTTYASAHTLIPLVVLFFVLSIVIGSVMWVIAQTREGL